MKFVVCEGFGVWNPKTFLRPPSLSEMLVRVRLVGCYGYEQNARNIRKFTKRRAGWDPVFL